MTDPSTLFLSAPQVRPSWTLNGLTLELNLAPAHGIPLNAGDNSNYAAQTFQAVQPQQPHLRNATASTGIGTGTVFASVMGQGQHTTPVRFAVRGGSSCWTHQANTTDDAAVSNDLQTAVGDSVFAVTQSASFLSTSTLNGTVPAVSSASTLPNALIPSNPVIEQNMSQMNNCAGFYVSSVTAGTIEDASKKPVFLASSAGQQVSENVEKKKRQKAITEGPSTGADDDCTLVGESRWSDRTVAPKKTGVGTPCQVAEITTSVVNEVRDGSTVAKTAQATTIVSASPVTTTSVVTSVPASKIATPFVPITANVGTIGSNNGIPVGIAVARQRYVSSTTCKSQTQNLKESITTSSASSPYASSIPYQPIIEPSSLFPPAISNIGVVAGTTGCDDRSIANISGSILPSIIAWPQQQQQQQPQQHALQQWYPYAGAMETVAPNISPACTGYQLVRDPVSGHIILIPANQIGSTHSTATAGFATTTTTNQQLQSFLIPQQHFQQQQQSQSHSLFLDHLVSVVPSSTNIKQNSVSTLLKLHDGVLTGVMMPCDMGKTSVVNPTQTTSTIGQQLLSTNNSSISLLHQFNSSNIHNPNINAPHHFSSISSSGSLLIQQISGNTGQSPVINHINNSVMIAESSAMQSVINTQPAYSANNTSYLINAPVSTTESARATVNQVQPAAACIVSNSLQQTATYGQSSTTARDMAKSTIVQSKIVNIEKQVNIETKATDASEQTWPPQSTAQILVEKTEESAVIKIDTNSIVQDASNQTDDNDDKDEDEEYTSEEVNEKNCDNAESLRSENEEDTADALGKLDPSRKSKGKCSKSEAGEQEMAVYNDADPVYLGLQVLLNGIERVEHSVSATTNAEKESADKEVMNTVVDGEVTNAVAKGAPDTLEVQTDDSDKDTDKPAPNGLAILCEYVKQRIHEEKSDSDELSEDDDDADNVTPPSYKGSKSHHSYKSDVMKSSKDAESEQGGKRFISSQYRRHRLPSVTVCDTDPLQMRIELAKLQKKYRETRKELTRLTHHRKRERSSSRTRSSTPDDLTLICDNKPDRDPKTVKRRPGRPRKYGDVLVAKRVKSVDDDVPTKPSIRPMKRPKLKLDTTTDPYTDGSEDDVKVSNENNGDLSPPVLEPMCSPFKSKPFKSEVLSPPTLVANKILFMGPKGLTDDNERLWPCEFENKPFFHRLSSDDLTDEDVFKRKEMREPTIVPPKRKVGRPRKYNKEDADLSKSHKPYIHKKSALNSQRSSEKQIPVTSSVVSTFALLKSQRADANQNADVEYKPKITPKLKAEAKFKTWRQKSPEISRDTLDIDFEPKKKKIDPLDTVLEKSSDRNSYPFTTKRDKFHVKEKSFSSSNSNSSTSNLSRLSLPNSSTKSSSSTSTNKRSMKFHSSVPPEYSGKDFKITPELLDATEKHPLRVLVPVGNLFRAGELSAVRPPDLYGIKLDGERGQKTHIYTKEEVLKDVVLEVRGKYPLRIGTRVCAFWSSQYQSLYPGNVTSFSSLDESEDENYTAVEFDDGDSGRIKINNIRVLPQDIAINRKDDSDSSESLGKRKRRISSVSFDEIPVDKQLHSPDHLSSHRHKLDTHDDLQPSNSSNSLVEPTLPSPNQANSDAEKSATSNFGDKKKNSERKKLKKKHKDKIRDNSDSSCKRKSHKHRSDTDEGSSKSHKRHKHKHKHHKHHKRKRSHDTDRCESDSHYKCSSKSGKAIKVDELLDEDLDWTSVPPYSSHLTDAQKSEFSSPKPNSPNAREKTEFKSSTDVITPKKASSQSKTDSKDNDEKKPDTKKLKEESNIDSEKVEIKRIRPRRSIDYSESKDEIDFIGEDSENLNSIDNKRVNATEQRDSSPSEETDASTSSRRESDSTSDSASSSADKFWDWHGKGVRRNGKGRARKEFYKTIKRGDVIINVGDCAVFLTAGGSAKPFIGRIESMWESYNNMMVRVNWFYHPEETTGLKKELPFLGALFESPHTDKNDVQTISHKCEVVSIKEYRERLEKEPDRLHNVYESNDLYYLAGHYDPTAKRLEFEEEIFT